MANAAPFKTIRSGRVRAGATYRLKVSELIGVCPIPSNRLAALEVEIRMLRQSLAREREISDDYRIRLGASEVMRNRLMVFVMNQSPKKKRFGMF